MGMQHGDNASKDREQTGCIMCGAQCQTKMQDPMFKNDDEFNDGDSQAFH